MTLSDRLQRIRPRSGLEPPRQQQVLRLLLACAFGACMGLLAKAADSVPVLGTIATELSAWVLVATLLAAWSRSPRAAALHVFAFFAAMLVTYYAYSMHLFGFFPRHYFLAWGGIALISPLAAYAVWYARGDGWMAALCASAPVALLLAEGYTSFYNPSIPRAFALLSGLALFAILPTRKAQWLCMLPLVAILFLLITQFGARAALFGGL